MGNFLTSISDSRTPPHRLHVVNYILIIIDVSCVYDHNDLTQLLLYICFYVLRLILIAEIALLLLNILVILGTC